MKKTLSFMTVLALVLCLVTPTGVRAASAKTKVRKMVSYMQTYEWMMLFDLGLADGEGYEIVLDNAQMAQAAALTVNLSNADIIECDDEFGFWSVYSVPSSRVKKMSQKLFGKAVSYKKLSKEKMEDIGGFIRAYRNDEGKPVIYCWEGETETDYEIMKQSVGKSGAGYKVVKDLYYGYWGMNDHKTANYRITYRVEKNEVSSYGFAITKMKIEKLAD